MSWERRRFKSPSDVAQQRAQQSSGLARSHDIDPCDLFCAYHLGLTAEGDYRFQNIHHVAKRFGTNAAVIKQLLVDFGMDPETVIHSAFDLAGAQVDVMLAPEGLNRAGIAREFYEEFRKAPRKARNWQKELEQDARDNERTFGPGRSRS